MRRVGRAVLDRVGQQVLQQQAEIGLVGVDDDRGRPDDLDRPVGMARPERGHGPFDDADQHLRLEVRLRARAEPRQVEQVLDDGVEPVGVGRDVRDHRLADVLVQPGAACLQQTGVPEDRGDRRPQLVRDEAEELVLDRVGRLERVGCRAGRLLGATQLRDVDQDVDRADQLAVIVEQRRGIGHERHLRPVRTLGDGLSAPDRTGLLERDRHRALVVPHRPAIGPAQPQRAAPRFAQRRTPAPELGGGGVEERDAAVAVRRVDRHAERVEEAAIAIGTAPGGPSRGRGGRRGQATGQKLQQVAVGHRIRQGRRPGVGDRWG